MARIKKIKKINKRSKIKKNSSFNHSNNCVWLKTYHFYKIIIFYDVLHHQKAIKTEMLYISLHPSFDQRYMNVNICRVPFFSP